MQRLPHPTLPPWASIQRLCRCYRLPECVEGQADWLEPIRAVVVETMQHPFRLLHSYSSPTVSSGEDQHTLNPMEDLWFIFSRLSLGIPQDRSSSPPRATALLPFDLKHRSATGCAACRIAAFEGGAVRCCRRHQRSRLLQGRSPSVTSKLCRTVCVHFPLDWSVSLNTDPALSGPFAPSVP